jgi:hypothetical protein
MSCQVRDMLHAQMSESECQHVFTSPKRREKALTMPWVHRQLNAVKARGDFPPGTGLHALRVTFFVDLCQVADLFTAAAIAGHSIRTTMKFTAYMKVNWKALLKLQTEESEEN